MTGVLVPELGGELKFWRGKYPDEGEANFCIGSATVDSSQGPFGLTAMDNGRCPHVHPVLLLVAGIVHNTD